uniref:Uncharacterized protein n=1 Tax=Amphimedon queenslandica TaxID=400682 RepID=A0A1X7TPB1_AMPQE
MLHLYISNLIILMDLVTKKGLHLDLCYLRICIYIGNSFPLYFLMLLQYINVGPSLNTAIIDLPTDVFGEVSNLCINEINRQRSKFQKDLPQIKKSKGKKRKIQVTGIIDDGEPCSKNAPCNK